MIKLSLVLSVFGLIATACSSSDQMSRETMSKTFSEDGSGRFLTKSGGKPVWLGQGAGPVFAFDPGLTPAYRTACRSAADTINAAVERSLITFKDKDQAYAAQADGRSTISFGKSGRITGDGQVAETFVAFTDTRIVEADIDFGQRMVTSDVDVESICLHEMGHAVGLVHVIEPASIMFESLTVGHLKRSLSPLDEERLRAAYPNQTPKGS